MRLKFVKDFHSGVLHIFEHLTVLSFHKAMIRCGKSTSRIVRSAAQQVDVRDIWLVAFLGRRLEFADGFNDERISSDKPCTRG
jgi:hypothetical protein